jgi:hypothetical protein
MLVSVMFIMEVFMIVQNFTVNVFVFMTLRQMKPSAQRHQGASDDDLYGD